jgi:diguanylate cyclase (GGDEF)-like protein/PAS domain S-box-containing protein
MHVPEDTAAGAAQWVRMVAVAAAFALVTAAGNLFTLDHGRISVFWPANGMLVAYLLTRPTREWWKLAPAVWVGNVAAYAVSHWPMGEISVLAVCNLLEVVIASVLLRRGLRRFGDLASRGMMAEFLAYAVLLAPAVGVLLAAAYMRLALGSSVWQTFRLWFPADAMGMALMVPITLAVLHPDLRGLLGKGNLWRQLGVLAVVLCVTLLVFGQTHYPLLFLLFPLMMAVVFEAGVFVGFLVLLEILIVGAQFTMHGIGPFWLYRGVIVEKSVVRLQLYVLFMAGSIVPVGAILDRQRQLRRSLHQGMERYRLLADNCRDIVVLASLEGRRRYVSPAVADVLGWTPAEWVGQNAADSMHADDVAPFRRLLREMLHGEDKRTFRYRSRHKNGRYVWMEASIRTLLDNRTGRPNCFVANVRDISERVDAEQKLSQAYEQMQQQAQQDGLTGLANRRRFDEGLDAEWRRGRRTGRNLSLLMVDIDNFKHINDTYGHRAGDYCLQAVAGCLRMTARRPSDVIARYGGEEFALLLPDVELATALVMAEGLCLKVRDLRVDAGVGRELVLTVSVGVAAQVPDTDVRADVLVEAADRALYAAKLAGRNRVMPGCEEELAASSPYHVH